MVNLRPAARPDSRESEGDDGGLGETLWRKQQRDSIKKGSMLAAPRAEPKPLPRETSGLKAPQELPPLKGLRVPLALGKATESTEAKRGDSMGTSDAGLAAKRARADAQAQSSACWEDLISFLEMNKLSGAYALAFAAYGIEDLSSLLLLEDAKLSSLLEKCNIDAMDEILLLEALRSSRPLD